MILRLTPTTATLVGETPAEWEMLEKQVRGAAVDDRRARGRPRPRSGIRIRPARRGPRAIVDTKIRAARARCPPRGVLSGRKAGEESRR